jgi:nicotinate phosphoribosyltransferase
VEKMRLVKENAGWEKFPFLFADFGTRRRFSFQWQLDVLQAFRTHIPFHLVGTSNVLLAKELDLTPIGTMAHEWIQAHQALYRIADSQFMAFENWAKEYRGDLGIALSDTIGLEAFLCDFDMYFAKLFDGTRQDSGSPTEYANQMIKHYEAMKIDPRTKTIVFSDGLTMEIALNLWKAYAGRIKTSFGIGTHLTNDFDYKPLQIVLKMVKCNGQPVAKLSNSPGKTMCTNQSYLDYLRATFQRKVENGKQKV